MLQEIKDLSQVPGEPFRRWFCDDNFELIVWYDDNRKVSGFQLCYRAGTAQKAFTWLAESGATHRAVDDGERTPGRYKMTPILVEDGVFEQDRVTAQFRKSAADLECGLVAFIIDKLENFAANGS